MFGRHGSVVGGGGGGGGDGGSGGSGKTTGTLESQRVVTGRKAPGDATASRLSQLLRATSVGAARTAAPKLAS